MLEKEPTAKDINNGYPEIATYNAKRKGFTISFFAIYTENT